MAVNQAEDHHAEQTDEINLIDYINVLCKWKKMIILGTLSCMLIAGIVSFRLHPVYRVDTMVEVGLNSGGQYIEAPNILVEKIREGIYDVIIQREMNIKEKDYPGIVVKHLQNTPLVELSINSPKREWALNILRAMSKHILENHSELIRLEKYNIGNAIKEIDNQANLIEWVKDSIKKKIELNQKNKDQTKKQLESIASRIFDLEREKARVDRDANFNNTLSLLLFSNEIQDNRRYYNELQDKLTVSLEKEDANFRDDLANKEKSLKSLMLEKEKLTAQLQAFRDTRVVKTSSSENPISPSKRRIVFFTSIIAFTALIFIAFFREYLAKCSVS